MQNPPRHHARRLKRAPNAHPKQIRQHVASMLLLRHLPPALDPAPPFNRTILAHRSTPPTALCCPIKPRLAPLYPPASHRDPSATDNPRRIPQPPNGTSANRMLGLSAERERIPRALTSASVPELALAIHSPTAHLARQARKQGAAITWSTAFQKCRSRQQAAVPGDRSPVRDNH